LVITRRHYRLLTYSFTEGQFIGDNAIGSDLTSESAKHSVRMRLEGGFGCTVCTRVFVSVSNARRHAREANGQRRYECPTCQKTFSQQSGLTKHVKVHERGGRITLGRARNNAVKVRHDNRHEASPAVGASTCEPIVYQDYVTAQDYVSSTDSSLMQDQWNALYEGSTYSSQDRPPDAIHQVPDTHHSESQG
jgi:hypothetical protein